MLQNYRIKATADRYVARLQSGFTCFLSRPVRLLFSSEVGSADTHRYISLHSDEILAPKTLTDHIHWEFQQYNSGPQPTSSPGPPRAKLPTNGGEPWGRGWSNAKVGRTGKQSRPRSRITPRLRITGLCHTP